MVKLSRGRAKEMIEGYLTEHPDATSEQIGSLLGVSQQRAYQLLKLLGIRTSRQLTERELKILRCIASGNGNRQIAEALNLSEQTIKNETTVILAKLKAKRPTIGLTLWYWQCSRGLSSSMSQNQPGPPPNDCFSGMFSI